ncbi:MAG: SLC13 family permease [Planctomycetota bacterium]
MKNWTLILCPAIAIGIGIMVFRCGGSAEMAWTAAVTLLVASWWILEPIPIPATSLIPLAVFPLVGVLDQQQVAAAYGDSLILLMLGGFLLSGAMERSGAHRRIALGMVNLCGASSGRRLVLGFMAASALLSMWISNAATTLMLLPIAMAIVAQTKNAKLQISLLLGIAFAASIGGIGTPIGTPPNVVFMALIAVDERGEIGFLQWMMWSIPIVLLMLPIAGFWLTRGLGSIEPIELPKMGAWRSEEIRTLIVFGITALLWVTRTQPWGGWSAVLQSAGMPIKGYVNDSTVALLGAIALFVLPNGKGERLLNWESASKVPWGVLILFAGGLCISIALKSSGLSEQLGLTLSGLGALPTLLLIFAVCLAATFLTEVTSNTATAALLLPILATAASAAEIDPRLLMVPATISASFAFMLSVATPPNAIVFGSGRLSVNRMAREGFVLNLVGIVIVTAVTYLMLR